MYPRTQAVWPEYEGKFYVCVFDNLGSRARSMFQSVLKFSLYSIQCTFYLAVISCK